MKKLFLIIFSITLLNSIFLYADQCIDGNCMNGYGTMVYDGSGDYYEQVNDYKMTGQGMVIYADGTKYTGQFQNGLMHGEGTITYVNGAKYTGQFLNGLMHGQGTIYKKDGSIEKTGFFQNGEFVGETASLIEPSKTE